MALVIQPPIVALAPGATAVVTVYDQAATGAIAATTNNPLVATVSGGGNAPGPVSFTITAPAATFGGCTIFFTCAGTTDTAGIPVVIIPQSSTMVPQTLTAALAVARVRRRTNLNFGQPADEDIIDMLNEGIEQVALNIEPILTSASLAINSPNTNTLAFPYDVARVRNANYSTGNPALGGTVVYEMVQLPYDEFIQETDSTPAGGIGGIPTIYSLVQDSSGVQVIQFYPFANSGQINLNYYKRPGLWALGNPGSTPDLDSGWIDSSILYACALACENREDLQTGAAYYMDLYNKKVEEQQLTIKRRARKNGTNVVRDVSAGESVVPTWVR